jgi:glycosyltransferase involved in cell wall biosynthesis
VRIVHASKAYFPHLGGIETVVKQLAEDAADRGHETGVLVTQPATRSDRETIAGVVVDRVAAPVRIASLPVSPSYPMALARTSADVLVVHEPSLLAAATLHARPRLRNNFGAIVVWWHSDVHRQKVAAPLYTPIFNSLLDAAQRIVVATPHHIDSSPFLQRCRSKIEVIPFGIPLEEFVLDPDRVRRVDQLRAERRGVNIVSIGRLVPYKGHLHLLDAIAGLDDVSTTIIGDGPGRDELTAHPAYRSGRVRLLPSMSRTAMIDELHAADIFAFPSVHNSEAFGISQVEAMACGVPVICFGLPTGVTWVNRHEQTGLVCPVGDTAALRTALKRLAQDAALRLELGQMGLERARNVFGERSMLDAFDDLACSLIRRPAVTV